MMGKVDLLLGGEQGLWALGNTPEEEIGTVYTWDPDILRAYPKAVFKSLGATGRRAPYAISVHFPRILSETFIGWYRKIYNIHPGYLPWGRGMYPVFWALWEQTPAGATLHEIDAGIDTGPIVDQVVVRYDLSDTGKTLHDRVKQAERHLYANYRPRIAAGQEPESHLQEGAGSYHTLREFMSIKKHTDLRRLMGRDLLRLIMALSYPGYSGLEWRIRSKRFEIVAREL